MNVLILGGTGQVGRALAQTAPPHAKIVSYGRDTLDITDHCAVEATVSGLHPDLIFNAAAYTAVDRAEGEEPFAHAVNATAVGILAKAAHTIAAQLVHISTDFVFDGTRTAPYTTDAMPNPLNAYGRSKLAGEIAAGADALIVRTAWLHAPTGANFVRTMLRMMAERSEVRVVADQIGSPTCASGLAAALWTLAGQKRRGIYHYTDSGAASWFDFAVAIQEEALAVGLLEKAVPVLPIITAQYPTAARRPHYTVLDSSSTFQALGQPAPHWRNNLRYLIARIKDEG